MPEALSENDIAWIAAELAVEVNRINCRTMSIASYRDNPDYRHIPGWSKMTMSYRDGGRKQVFTIGEQEVEFGGEMPSAAMIAAALEDKKKVSATP